MGKPIDPSNKVAKEDCEKEIRDSLKKGDL
jgi:hypothetical protein